LDSCLKTPEMMERRKRIAGFPIKTFGNDENKRKGIIGFPTKTSEIARC
jgi:hypothetical protein